MIERFAFARIALANDMVDRVVIEEALGSDPARDLGEILLERQAMTAADVDLVRSLRRRELAREQGAPASSPGSSPDSAPGSSPGSSPGSPLDEDEDALERRTIVRHPSGVPPVDVTSRAQEDALQRHKYVLLDPIGEGGQGLVRCASDTDIDRLVAVKVLKPEMADEGGIERFMLEIRTTGKLEHPNIVPVYDMGKTSDGLPYYVMRYVRGQTLQEIVEKLGAGRDPELARQFPRARLLNILYQVAMGIQFAHDHHCLHCDLKPANIVIGDYGEAVILDWGLVLDRTGIEGEAESTDSIKVVSGEGGWTYGTPQYMSPEQARGQVQLFDARTDVYALGTLLYEILTYTIAFPGHSVMEIMVNVISGRLDPPSTVAPEREIPEELERICMTAMSISRRDRQQSARQFAEEILEFLEGAREKERLRQAAIERAAEGDLLLQEHRDLQEKVWRLGREVEDLESALASGSPMDARRQLWALEEELDATRQSAVITLGRTTDVFTTALGLDPGCVAARHGLSDIYWTQFLEAEALDDRATAALMRTMVERLDDGRHAEGLRGDGTLSVRCDREDAEVFLHDLIETGRRLVPQNGRVLGATPLDRVRLPMGRHVLVVSSPGTVDLKIPFRMQRSDSCEIDLIAHAPEQIPPGFVLVPRGAFQYQGDATFRGSLEGRVVELPDFCIGQYPVTCAEYREYLEDLAQHDPQEAQARAPRVSRNGEPFWVMNADGRFTTRAGDEEPWGDRYPIRYVSWHDATAYTSWLTDQIGHAVTLPTEEEWEKAARSCDARVFPWGDRFDPSFCNVASKEDAALYPATVDDHAGDESPYGVRGMGGNVQDWCATAVEDRADMRLLRGGTFRHPELTAQICRRRARPAEDLGLDCGFRLRTLPLPASR